MTPFDLVNAASQGKDEMTSADNPALVESIYSPFLTNKAFSYHIDCILYANELNRYFSVDNKLQYLYYVNALKPKKRWAKWVKGITPEHRDVISKRFGVGKREAEEILSLLTPEQIEELIPQEGGVVGKKKVSKDVAR